MRHITNVEEKKDKAKKRKYERSKKIHMYDKEYNYLLTFPSVAECARFLNIHFTTVISRFRNKDIYIDPKEDMILSTTRYYKDALRKAVRIQTDVLCNLNSKKGSKGDLIIYNRLGEKIGQVASLDVLLEIQQLSVSTLYRSVKNTEDELSDVAKISLLYEENKIK